jgi:hypothetical protein
MRVLFHMDEAAWNGTPNEVVDSAAAFDGTAVAGATTTSAGRFGRAGSFPGAAGCVAVRGGESLRFGSDVSVTAWMMPTGLGRGVAQGIAAKRVNFQQASEFAFFVGTGDRLTVDVDTEDDRFEAGPVLTNGRWYHVAFAYDGEHQAVTVYLNGAAVGQHSERAQSITPFGSPLWVGCLPEGTPSQGFIGLLDDVAIWGESLSAADIAAVASGTGPIADP